MKLTVSRQTVRLLRVTADPAVNNETRHEISVVIADTVPVGFHCLHDSTSFWLVILGTAAEVHVIVHVFSKTFVAIERMEPPPGVQLDPQMTDQQPAAAGDRQHNDDYAGD